MIAVFFSIIQVTQANDQKHRNFPKTPAHTPHKMCKNKEFAEKSAFFLPKSLEVRKKAVPLHRV